MRIALSTVGVWALRGALATALERKPWMLCPADCSIVAPGGARMGPGGRTEEVHVSDYGEWDALRDGFRMLDQDGEGS